jgi:hypothetical protein
MQNSTKFSLTSAVWLCNQPERDRVQMWAAAID